jgi:hypothetical protein
MSGSSITEGVGFGAEEEDDVDEVNEDEEAAVDEELTNDEVPSLPSVDVVSLPSG